MTRAALAAAAGAAALLLTAAAAAQTPHPANQPPLTPDGPYPRCSAWALQMGGFPDHMHVWHWSGWEPPVGADGLPYGPESLCHGKVLQPRAGLELAPGRVTWRRLVLEHNPAYGPCDMLPFLEIVDMARRQLGALLALDPPDTLRLVNPDNLDQYRALTGQGTWRLYRDDGEQVVLQPIGTLQARTLDGHAAYQLVAQWLLETSLPAALPAWLEHGLVEYLSEDGVHLVNYMAEFRAGGPVLLAPAIAEHLLAAGVDPDPARDREMFRRASYTAFLMAWELVENQGGMAALREFLHAVRDGEDPDAAAVGTWGWDLQELAAVLDPTQLGEPIGDAVQPRRPHLQP